MVLGFKEKFPWGEETYFIAKIWAGLILNDLAKPKDFAEYAKRAPANIHFPTYEVVKSVYPKIHTIREDKANRWEVGNIIQFYVGAYRQGERFKFAPDLKVRTVQYIDIEIKEGWTKISIEPLNKAMAVKDLPGNDGFNGMNDFKKYFSPKFSGKIIHWTNFQYL